MAKNADVDPWVLLACLDLCKSTHLRVKYTLDHISESDDLASLLEIHELLSGSLSEAKNIITKLRDLGIQPLVNAVVHGNDLHRDAPIITAITTAKSTGAILTPCRPGRMAAVPWSR